LGREADDLVLGHEPDLQRFALDRSRADPRFGRNIEDGDQPLAIAGAARLVVQCIVAQPHGVETAARAVLPAKLDRSSLVAWRCSCQHVPEAPITARHCEHGLHPDFA